MAAVFQHLTSWITRFSIFTVFFVALFVRYGITVPFDNNVTADLAGIKMPAGALSNYYIALVMVYLTIAATLAAFNSEAVLRRQVQRLPSWQGLVRQAQRLSTRQVLPVSTRQPEGPTPRFEGSVNATLLAILILGVSLVVLITWVILPWRDFYSGLIFFSSLNHTSADYATHRVQYSQATAVGSSLLTYVGSFFRFAVLPPLAWIGLFQIRQTPALIPVVAVALGLLATIGLATGQKQPELYIGVGLALALLIRSRRPSLFNWKVGALVAVGIFVIIPTFYHFQYPQQSYQRLITTTIERLTSTYSMTAQLRFLFYPNIHPFLFGASSFYVETALKLLRFNISGLTPPEIYIPAVVLGKAYDGGSWNTAFFAEAWADFGFVGCFVESVVVASLLAAVDRWYVNSGRGPITQGTYMTLLISSTYFTDTALSTALWTYGFLPAIILFWLLKRVSTVIGTTPPRTTASRPSTPQPVVAPREAT
jgi:hypothetical protein